MFIKRNLKSVLMPVAIAAAAVMAPGVASANAVAQGYLFLSNFTFSSSTGVPVIQTATDSGDVSATINGGATQSATFNSGSTAGDFTLTKSVGPNSGAYVPGTAMLGAPTQNFVGSYASVRDQADNPGVEGNPFLGNVFAGVDNSVSLNPGGVGTAQSNTNLASTFLINVQAGTVLGVSFTADAFLRAMLDPFMFPGSANASYLWNISVTNLVTNQRVFRWTPNGEAGGITGGTEIADPFALDDERGLTVGGFDLTTGVQNGYFEAKSNALVGGLYQVNITHLANADALINYVPEPGSLSLVAMALMAVGVASRRRKVLS